MIGRSTGAGAARLAALVALCACAPAPLAAQGAPQPVELEILAGASHPVPCILVCEGVQDDDRFARAFDFGVLFPLTGSVSVGGALSYYDLGTTPPHDQGGIGVTTSLRFGGGPGPWIEVGPILHRRRYHRYVDGRRETRTTGFGAGYSLGLGARIPLGDRFGVSPSLLYRSFEASGEAVTVGEHVVVPRISTEFFLLALRLHVGLR